MIHLCNNTIDFVKYGLRLTHRAINFFYIFFSPSSSQCFHKGCDPFVLIKFHRLLFYSFDFIFHASLVNTPLIWSNIEKQWNMGQLWMVVGPSRRWKNCFDSRVDRDTFNTCFVFRHTNDLAVGRFSNFCFVCAIFFPSFLRFCWNETLKFMAYFGK